MSEFDFADLVDSFANEGGDSSWAELPIARDQGSDYVDGIATSAGWLEGTLELAFVTPVSPRELEALPEGIRERGAVKVFTREAVFGVRWGASSTDGRRGDVIAWQGACWQFTEVNDYSRAGGFWESTAVRMDRPAATVAAFVLEELAEAST